MQSGHDRAVPGMQKPISGATADDLPRQPGTHNYRICEYIVHLYRT